MNLRGNAKLQGERRRQEGDNIFGSGSKASVAITILVRNPEKRDEGCRILYHDIGDYMKREVKLAILRDAESVAGIAEANPKTGWREITPDEHHDWVGQRGAAFQGLYPIGSKEVKAGKADDAVFRLFSSGYKTSRDAYTYNFSGPACAANAQAMVEDYMGAMVLRERVPDISVEDAADQNSSSVRWDRELKNNLRRGKKTSYSDYRVRTTQYRPFIRSRCYIDYLLVNTKYQQDRLFPLDKLRSSRSPIVSFEPSRAEPSRAEPSRAEPSPNRAICVPGVGSTKPFSALIVETMPDLEVISKGQCFPRYRYRRSTGPSASRESARRSHSPPSSRNACPTSTSSRSDSASQGGSTPVQGGIFDDADLFPEDRELERIDNITDTALRRFRIEYSDRSITKDAIFDYVYGVLHSPHYREHFANDLAKGLPRIPFAPDFRAFADAGAVLAELHLRYEDEDFPEHPLDVVSSTGHQLRPDYFRLGKRRMRFADKKVRDTLIVNDRVRLSGIPPEAHRYVVNGRTPLEWLMFYYHVKTDNRSGIVNDANGWFDDPRDLVTAIKRIVYLSVETARIVDGLPDPLADAG